MTLVLRMTLISFEELHLETGIGITVYYAVQITHCTYLLKKSCASRN